MKLRDWANCLAEQIEVYDRVVLEPKIKERNDLKQKIDNANWWRKMKFNFYFFVYLLCCTLISLAITYIALIYDSK